jgi:hypothetical protein
MLCCSGGILSSAFLGVAAKVSPGCRGGQHPDACESSLMMVANLTQVTLQVPSGGRDLLHAPCSVGGT